MVIMFCSFSLSISLSLSLSSLSLSLDVVHPLAGISIGGPPIIYYLLCKHTHTHCYHTYLTSPADSKEDSEAESDSGVLSITRTTIGDGVQSPLSTLCMEGTTVC